MGPTQQIVDVLITRGQELFASEPGPHAFSGDARSDQLINDLECHPHAFVIACIADRQVKAEVAWRLPWRLGQRLGTFSFGNLAALSLAELTHAMTHPTPLHRFKTEISKCIHSGVARIRDEYGGNAARIWSTQPTCSTVVSRFLAFRGIGPKIAHMATNILARDLRVPLSDYSGIDIAVDVHVERVFGRLGLSAPGASRDHIVARARELSPKFPGLLDLPSWEVGRIWCRPTHPDCRSCSLGHLCPSSNR